MHKQNKKLNNNQTHGNGDDDPCTLRELSSYFFYMLSTAAQQKYVYRKTIKNSRTTRKCIKYTATKQQTK